MMCVICHKEIEKQYTEEGVMYWDQGNNAEPISEGRCCNECNRSEVLPARLAEIQISLTSRGRK